MRKVLLLRSGTDGTYDDLATGWSSVSVSPIEKKLINIDQLRLELANNYDGIILTSRTAVQALNNANVKVNEKWPVFVVGGATGRAARELGLVDIVGESSGDAVRLAPQIIAYFDQTRSIRLLHPGATKMIGGLHEKLQPANIESIHLPVYETTSRQEDELSGDLAKLKEIDACVYFSPSGVKAARHLVKTKWPNAREIAIGNTTAASLDDSLVAKDPNAKGNLPFTSW